MAAAAAAVAVVILYPGLNIRSYKFERLRQCGLRARMKRGEAGNGFGIVASSTRVDQASCNSCFEADNVFATTAVAVKWPLGKKGSQKSPLGGSLLLTGEGKRTVSGCFENLVGLVLFVCVRAGVKGASCLYWQLEKKS